LLGGLIGIAIGRIASLFIGGKELALGAHVFKIGLGWPVEISWPAMFISFIVSGTVGIIFGFYPAWKASRLDPIEALRYE
jgi:ABC-type antimicrobial peptide transport system permease subunit